MNINISKKRNSVKLNTLKMITGMTTTSFNSVVSDIVDAKVDLNVAIEHLNCAAYTLDEVIQLCNVKPKTHQEAAKIRFLLSKTLNNMQNAIDTVLFSTYNDVCKASGALRSHLIENISIKTQPTVKIQKLDCTKSNCINPNNDKS